MADQSQPVARMRDLLEECPMIEITFAPWEAVCVVSVLRFARSVESVAISAAHPTAQVAAGRILAELEKRSPELMRMLSSKWPLLFDGQDAAK